VHIVLLELLIDPACSIVFEAEPESADIMSRPPRPSSQSPFARGNLEFAVIQGLGFAAILLVGYGLLLARGVDAAGSRTAVFIALVLGLFLLTLANRDPSRSLLAPTTQGNPWLLRMFGGVVTLLTVVIVAPFFRGVMGLVVPDSATLVYSALMLTTSCVWLEGLRRLWHFKVRRQT
jgi:Ca2+-transporting ATPase